MVDFRKLKALTPAETRLRKTVSPVTLFEGAAAVC